MKIFVKAKPNSKKEAIEKISETEYAIRIKEPAREGRANKKIIELLADYFKIAKGNIRIVVGEKTKSKIIEINNET